MIRPKLLVVDDDPDIRVELRNQLDHQFLIGEAEDGLDCLCCLGELAPDLIVMDAMMPRLDGWSTLKRIRTYSRVPVIMLIPGGDVDQRVHALRLGANGWLCKPLNARDVAARVGAVLRQSGLHNAPKLLLRQGPFLIDPVTRTVKLHNTKVHLTPLELDVLVFLATHPNQTISRAELLDGVWGPDFDGEPRLIDGHIMNLRRKFGDDRGSLIASVWGVGYQFSPAQAPGDPHP